MHPLPSSRDSAVEKKNLELPWSWSLDCDDSNENKPNLLVFSKLFWSRESSGITTITLPWRSSVAHWYVRLFPKPVGAQTSTCSCFAEYPAIYVILAAKDITLLTNTVQSVCSWCWRQTGTIESFIWFSQTNTFVIWMSILSQYILQIFYPKNRTKSIVRIELCAYEFYPKNRLTKHSFILRIESYYTCALTCSHCLVLCIQLNHITLNTKYMMTARYYIIIL